MNFKIFMLTNQGGNIGINIKPSNILNLFDLFSSFITTDNNVTIHSNPNAFTATPLPYNG